jgi:hypothetical protein
VPTGGVVTAAAAASAVAAILGAFDAFNRKRRPMMKQSVTEYLTVTYPDRTPVEIARLVQREMKFEREFLARQRDRLRRDIAKAMLGETTEERRAAVERVLERERRYEKMREEAALERAAAMAEMLDVRDQSPLGAFWILGEAREHTLDCIAMAGHFWPWEVLDKIHPQLHHGCQCRLLTFEQAVRDGYMREDQVPSTADAVRRAAEIARRYNILTETATPEEIRDYIEEIYAEPWVAGLAEAHYTLRFAKGLERGGQFMPRGGVSAPSQRKLVRKALRELVPHAPVSPADKRQVGYGRWRRVGGRSVFVPEHRLWERTLGGIEFYCLGPDTKILSADLEWRRLADLSVGAELVGFEEYAPEGRPRRFCPAVVESLGTARLLSFNVTTGWGTTVASENHRWLVRLGHVVGRKREHGSHVWLRTDELRPGDQIVSLCCPWEVDESREAGYIAGLYDGEGYVGEDGKLGVSQNPGIILESLRSLLTARGFDVSDVPSGSARTRTLHLRGGLVEDLRLLGSVRPQRLLARSHMVWDGRGLARTENSTVLAVEPIGEADVVTIGTTTQTLIADGLLSHNSPPQSTHVYQRAEQIRRSTPQIPPEHGTAITDEAMRIRERARADAVAQIQMALHEQSPGHAPVDVGNAHPKAVHSALVSDTGFHLIRQEVSPGTGGLTHEYEHGGTGSRVTVTYHDGRVTYVNWKPGKRAQAAGPVLTRPPRSWDEFTADVFNIAHDEATKSGHDAFIARVVYDPSEWDSAGSVDWNGVISLGKDTRPAIAALSRAQSGGESLSADELKKVHAAYQVATHEALHSAHHIPQSQYNKPEVKALEEALTEELSLVHVIEVLRRQGLNDVVAWARANPSDTHVAGGYGFYRKALGDVLARSRTPPDKYLDVLHVLKFSAEGDQRVDMLASLVAGGVPQNSDLHGNFEQARAWVMDKLLRADVLTGREMDPEFAPLLRPNFEGIPEPAPFKLHGQDVRYGQWVTVRDHHGQTHTGSVQRVKQMDDGARVDVRYGNGQVDRNVLESMITNVGEAPPGRSQLSDSHEIEGVTYKAGDRISYLTHGKRQRAVVERFVRTHNYDLENPEKGWQMEARTHDGKSVLLTRQRIQGLRKENSWLRRSPGSGSPFDRFGPIPEEPPKFKQIGSGVYDSADGRVTMYRVEGVRPAAWNVEWTTDYSYEATGVDHVDHSLLWSNLVDGAGSKKDAERYFKESWPETRKTIQSIETPPEPMRSPSRVPLAQKIYIAEDVMKRGGEDGGELLNPAGHPNHPTEEGRAASARMSKLAQEISGDPTLTVHITDWISGPGGDVGHGVYRRSSHTVAIRPVSDKLTFLHEIAHAMTKTGHDEEGHTPEFAAQARDLYEKHISPEAAQTFWNLIFPRLVEAARTEVIDPGCAICHAPATHVARGDQHHVYACDDPTHVEHASALAGVKAAPLGVDAHPAQLTPTPPMIALDSGGYS